MDILQPPVYGSKLIITIKTLIFKPFLLYYISGTYIELFCAGIYGVTHSAQIHTYCQPLTVQTGTVIKIHLKMFVLCIDNY